jgi:hypothetical protein
MTVFLAVFASLIGLAAAAAAIFTAYAVIKQMRPQAKGTADNRVLTAVGRSWTVLDYTVLVLFIVGMLFLLADVVGVLGDRRMYPPFHLFYLLIGFVFSLLGMLFMLARLMILLRPGQASAAPTGYQHSKPKQADKAE